jgi:hypothetical protein
MKAETKFSEAFEKVETKGGCVTTEDVSTIEPQVDAFVTDVVTELPPAPTPACQSAGAPGATGAATVFLAPTARSSVRHAPASPERLSLR